MCGIMGLYAHSRSNSSSIPKSLLNFIEQRGPDNFGSWFNDSSNLKVELYHSRLSIIDMSVNSSQPMSVSSSDWVITYNGEIYNYIEVRNELTNLGWQFTSDGDTEVLLKAWTQWGIDALPRFNGMFAFAAYNKISGEIWLVRDRFGVKPLVWARTASDAIVFSSSIAAVAQHIDANVDQDYCSFGLKYKAFEMPDGRTPFRRVKSIPAGGWIKISMLNDNLTMDNGIWYDLKKAVNVKLLEIIQISDDQLLHECKYVLEDAVKIRLRSDVPVAVALSGGLDSSTVASLAKKHNKELHGFTYGHPNAQSSEGPTVARFSNDTFITPHYIWPKYSKFQLESLLNDTLYCQEAPFPSLSVLAQNAVFKQVKQENFKVLLGGQGGDEIFSGYRKFFIVALREAFNNKDLSDCLRLIYSLGLMLLHESSQAKIYLTALKRYFPSDKASFNIFNWHVESENLWGDSHGTLTDRQIDDVMTWSIPSLLRYEDRNSMGHSVESRLPFMDFRLVELALALPSRLKINNGFGKSAIRQIMKGVVPDYIRLDRKKRGFDVTQTWIKSGLGEILRETILDNRDFLSDYIKDDINLESQLSVENISKNDDLLDEALMMVWLTNPIRTK
ncbi:MAG: asparagine synthase (glutamine-hydrolyzing) [Hellea sp.]